MKLAKLENSVIENETVYYTVVVFADPNKSGRTLENAYKTINGAYKAGAMAIWNDVKGGNSAARVNIRKETVIKRIPGKLELSSSGIAKRFTLEFTGADCARIVNV